MEKKRRFTLYTMKNAKEFGYIELGIGTAQFDYTGGLEKQFLKFYNIINLIPKNEIDMRFYVEYYNIYLFHRYCSDFFKDIPVSNINIRLRCMLKPYYFERHRI